MGLLPSRSVGPEPGTIRTTGAFFLGISIAPCSGPAEISLATGGASGPSNISSEAMAPMTASTPATTLIAATAFFGFFARSFAGFWASAIFSAAAAPSKNFMAPAPCGACDGPAAVAPSPAAAFGPASMLRASITTTSAIRQTPAPPAASQSASSTVMTAIPLSAPGSKVRWRRPARRCQRRRRTRCGARADSSLPVRPSITSVSPAPKLK